ncbi:helix-turn-helix domain-containing protein [Kitasatospora sp. NPDC058170]|uniref:helix-turn-helix domain-containing protein n=1 Tax=Kitasatospora sp. NPDC058170 TaxID=3346364 RepID=UPI0036DE4B53
MGAESDDLAAMLRALKDRSGRSYGSLAARLHVSTSTLHRYCNGAAVPTEYAPVERLARVCGAGADELVELHRRWILADAARRREPGGAAARAGAPAPSAEPKAEPAPEPEPAAKVVQAAEAAEAAQMAQVELADQVERAGAERRRRRLPYPRALLSAAAVVVLAAAIPVLGLGDRSPSPAPAPVAAPQPSAADGSAPAAASGPPAPSATAAAPSSAGPVPPTSTPTASAASGPAPTASATGAAEDPPPFHVNVLTDNWGSACDQWFLAAKAPGAMPAPPTTPRTDSWAAAQHAVPGGHLRLQLTAQGASAKPVVLHTLYVHVVSAGPAPKWNAYTMGSGCGGGLTPAAFSVDLDASAPRPVPVAGTEGAAKSRTSDFPYQVSATDPQVLNIDAGTASQDVSWYLDLVWSSGDRQGTLRVDDNGRPFRTAGLKGAPHYFYQDERRGWAPGGG